MARAAYASGRPLSHVAPLGRLQRCTASTVSASGLLALKPHVSCPPSPLPLNSPQLGGTLALLSSGGALVAAADRGRAFSGSALVRAWGVRGELAGLEVEPCHHGSTRVGLRVGGQLCAT